MDAMEKNSDEWADFLLSTKKKAEQELPDIDKIMELLYWLSSNQPKYEYVITFSAN